jgi:hypothetical protein
MTVDFYFYCGATHQSMLTAFRTSGIIRHGSSLVCPQHILYLPTASETPSLSLNGCTLRLDKKNFEIFSDLKQKLERVDQAIKSLKAATRKGAKNTVINEGKAGGFGDVEPVE